MAKPTIPDRPVLRCLELHELYDRDSKYDPLVIRCAMIAANTSINGTYTAGSQIAARILDNIGEDS